LTAEQQPKMSEALAGASVPLSVVLPTIGRAELLVACLASIAACEPGAAEIIVVDQSGDQAVRSAESMGASLR
jgi:glycosyltransferase involved in cell wall biosynthesis